MIKLIVGNKGTGKTKIMVDMIGKALETSNGNVVCIEKEPKLTYEIPSSVRLMETCKDDISGYAEFYGYLTGVLSGNFDITDLFIDSTLKIGGKDLNAFAEMIQKLEKAVGSREINIVFTVSTDASDIPESIKNHIC